MFVKLIQTNNILEDIFLPEGSRNRTTLLNLNSNLGASGNGNKDIYFYRYIGFDSSQEYISEIKKFKSKLNSSGCNYIEFDNKIAQPYNTKLTDRVNEALSKISELDIRHERGRETLSQMGLFNLFSDVPTNSLIREAYKTTMELYYANEPTASLSIEKNFIIKLFLWMGEYIPKLLMTSSDVGVPKVVYYGEIKKHEVYFTILLSQLGMDVLIIATEGEGDYPKVDRKLSFSNLVKFSNLSKLEYERETTQSPVKVEVVQSNSASLLNLRGNGSEDKPGILLKTATDIFEDICFPLSKRVGYIGLPSPVLPVYFYRYIGFSGNSLTSEDEYYNRIFSLDKKLSTSAIGYVKFINSVPPPMNDEVDELGRVIGFIKNFEPRDKVQLIEALARAGIVYNQREAVLNRYIRDAFGRVIELYLKHEASVNAAKFQNFVYKLIIWINRYFKVLKLGKGLLDSPKILYYGDIKHHEIYLLMFLNRIGCDVLYVTSEEQKDKPFLEIDSQEEYTKLQVNEVTAPMLEFPAVEKIIRKTTTAYNASMELENIIYSGDVGLYKPWQFEDYSVLPVTLRTTYDELKILWKEDGKIRPEFKIQNGTVYIPNLFAKISGTQENLEQYWTDYKALAKSSNTCEFTMVPFTWCSFTRQEIYSMAFLIGKDGSLNKEALESSTYYKFGYLRTSLQKLLVDKISELMKANIFRKPVDNNFKLLILITILSIDDRLLKLIETFDYPQEIPKVVIYNNSKEAFSDEDSIILAFLNSMGFDIAIFTPTNYNTIEQKLIEDMYDKFQLPSIQYELTIPSGVNNDNVKGKSIFSRMFGL